MDDRGGRESNREGKGGEVGGSGYHQGVKEGDTSFIPDKLSQM